VREYCSRQCQVAHWRGGHQRECRQFAALARRGAEEEEEEDDDAAAAR
jgi:hypothetical protein